MILRDNFLTLQTYIKYLKQKGKCSQATIELYTSYNNMLLEWAGERNLKTAPSFDESFQKFLSEQKNNSDKPYSKSYMKAACSYTRRFFYWARDNCKGYKNITGEWIDSIVPVRHIDEVKEIVYYSLDEVEKICALEPENLREQRTIAALAFLMLTGMRVSAFLTLPINNVHFDETKGFIRQNPKDGVCTKNNKAANTTTFVCSSLLKIVKEWDALVRSKCPGNTSWYARMDQNGNLNPREIIPMTLENADELKKKARYPYKNFCKDLKEICAKAGVEYKSPHKARYGHIHLCMSKAKTAEERKAVSMNVMHGSTAITDEVYMRMNSDQVSEILSGFNFDEPANNPDIAKNSGSPVQTSFDDLDSDTLLRMSQIFASMASSRLNK